VVEQKRAIEQLDEDAAIFCTGSTAFAISHIPTKKRRRDAKPFLQHLSK